MFSFSLKSWLTLLTCWVGILVGFGVVGVGWCWLGCRFAVCRCNFWGSLLVLARPLWVRRCILPKMFINIFWLNCGWGSIFLAKFGRLFFLKFDVGCGWSLSRFLFGVGGLISMVLVVIFGLQNFLSRLIEWVGFLVGVEKPASGFDSGWLSWRLGKWVSWLILVGILEVGHVGLGWGTRVGRLLWLGSAGRGRVTCLLLVGRVGKVGILVITL